MMEEAQEEVGTLSSLLTKLQEAAQVPSRQRKSDIKSTVVNVAEFLYENGALPDDLTRVVDLVTVKNHLNQSTQAALVRNMYPVGTVSGETVLKIVGSLGQGQRKPPTTVQLLLLKWLIMVYHLLERADVLSQCYSILFNLLDERDLRPLLCQLLALVTRRKHVQPHRVQTIFDLVRNEASDPALAALLWIFRNYHPEIALGGPIRGAVANFKYPNGEWRERLEEIQKNYLAKGLNETDKASNGFKTKNPIGRLSKRTVPLVRSMPTQKNSVTLEEISDAESLVQNLEKIELPTQLVAVLGDPLLQKLLRLRPDDEANVRVSYWIEACINDVISGDADQSTLLDMVETIYEFAQTTKSLPLLFFRFFQKLFQVWDGTTKSPLVLDILSFCPIMTFSNLYEQLFDPMEQALLDGTAHSQLLLLKFYKTLLQRWGILLSSAEDPSSMTPAAVSDLMRHADRLALTVSQTSPTTSTYLIILDFYEAALAIVQTRALLPHLEIDIPSPLLVYLMHFDQSLATLSRLYRLVATYKQALSSAGSVRGYTPGEISNIPIVNAFTLDIVNCIWRAKALNMGDAAAKGCLVPHDVVPHLDKYLMRTNIDAPVSAVFGLSYSPALCLQSTEHMRKLEDREMETSNLELRARHAGPVTRASLSKLALDGGVALNQQAYQSGVLRSLEAAGLPGVGDLMYSALPKTLRRPEAAEKKQ